MRKGGGIAILTALAMASPARAESVSMTGTFAAKAREVAMLEALAIDRFAGRDGTALAIALERRLADNGYFRIAASRRGGADGTVSGSVSTDVSESPFRRKEKRCVEKVEKKCVREEDQQIRCTRRTIEVEADVRFADLVDDRVLYSRPTSRRDETSWCENEHAGQSEESVIRGMVDDIAGELATTFAPRTERYSIRFLEGTKGMAKDQAQAFKAAVRQTKRDVPGACAAWAEQDRALPNHPSLVFNLGLCAEAAGRFGDAERRYMEAGRLGRAGEADAGIGRVRDILAAREDAAARGRR